MLNEFVVQMPTLPQTDPLAGMTPGTNVPPLQAPNRELNVSDSSPATLPFSFWTKELTFTATPAVSRTVAVVYQPCGTAALHASCR